MLCALMVILVILMVRYLHLLFSTNNRVVNPEFTLWTLSDNQLSSYLTASLSLRACSCLSSVAHISNTALLHKDEGTTSSKVLLATQKMPQNVVQEQASLIPQGSESTSQAYHHAMPSSSTITYPHTSIYQTSNTPGPFYTQQSYNQSNRNMNANGNFGVFNRGRGVRGSGFNHNTRMECQIVCGKNNHTGHLTTTSTNRNTTQVINNHQLSLN